MQMNSALAGRNDRIISTTSASDDTHSTEVLRPSFEAISMVQKRQENFKEQTWRKCLHRETGLSTKCAKSLDGGRGDTGDEHLFESYYIPRKKRPRDIFHRILTRK